MSNIKVVAVKFNLDKESDKKYYDKLLELDEGVYNYPAQYAKIIICKYLNELMKNKENQFEDDINYLNNEEGIYKQVIG